MGAAAFGKYRLIAELGHGGMADVFLAVQAGPVGSNFRKLSVIKRLRQNLVEEPEFVEMLIEEARIAARLNHPNVVQTNEVGEFDGQYFIAMEYLDGQPLHRIQHRSTQRIKDGKPALTGSDHQMIILMDALAGLHHAHELADYDGSPLQIVHRDVTPQNIFITYEGQVKVVDFGIAKAAGRASETRQGVVKGKVRYMAPEQAMGEVVDRRADVFSMGIMLWEVASGRRMWKDVDDLEIVRHLVGGTYPSSPRALNPKVTDELDRICQKALAKDRDQRYRSADELRADLEQYLADTGKLVGARRGLGPAVSELFQDKRTEIKNVIEQQLAALVGHGSGEFEAVPMPADSGSSAMHFRVQTHSLRPVATPPPPSVGEGVALAGPAPPRTRTARNALLIGAAVALAGAVALWRVAPDRAAAATPAPAAVEEIALHVKATPEAARVSIDDGPARRAPLDVRVPKDGREHRVRFEADGFVPRTELVRFAADSAVSVALLPLTAATVATPEKTPTKAPVPERAAVAPQPARNVTAQQAPTAPAVVAPEPPPEIAAPATPSEMPTKQPKKPKTELDNGDPWGSK